MAYVDRERASRQIPSIAGVVVVHALIGYAFISGLAGSVIHEVLPVFTVTSIRETLPPPPNPPEPAKTTPRQRETQEEALTTVVPLSGASVGEGPTVMPVPPILPTAGELPKVPDTPLLPPPSKAAPARAAGNRAAWITTEDYPSSALRSGEEGIVAISATVGADGRVSACTVTGSSGHPTLDAATCRLYARRARFTPALGADGMPTSSTYPDRVRWELPRE